MEFIHAYGEQLLVDDLKRFDVKVMELATAEEVENLYRTVPNEPYQAAYIKVMDRKTDTVYSRIYVFCAGQEEKCLNGDTYLSNKQHYVLVKKGDASYEVPYPFDCDKTVEALNRKNSEEEALTAAQRLFFWTEYKEHSKDYLRRKNMDTYNVVVTVSTTVCIDAESSDDAIEKVSQALNNDDANMSADVASRIGDSMRNGHYEVTDAIPMDE